MPGNIVCAECACGYSETLEPGAIMASVGEYKSFVIAYDDKSSTLITIDVALAEERNLDTVSDPFITVGSSDSYYRCPACGNNKLRLHQCGKWD